MMGSDISYQCIGVGKYKLIFKVYRDCRGVPLSLPIIKAFCNGVNAINVNYTRTEINDVSEKCDGAPNPCNPENSPSAEGIEEHVFEAIIDLNASPYDAFKKAGCCEIFFSVEQCCRNNAITTINKGNLYTEAMLNICNIAKTTNKCNTSPTLTIAPVAKICCNQPFIYNNGVTENVDGDSLVFSLVNPLNAHNSNESYVPTFTPKLPMTPYCPPNPGVLNCKCSPNANPPRGFCFDEYTGDIIFTPTNCEEVGVIVIQIDEYRKDSATGKMILVGRTRRDMQLVVKQCPENNPPKIISKKYNWIVCEGDLVEIDIDTKDDPYLPKQTRLDTVELTWNFGIIGGSLKIIDPKAREKKGVFTWQTKKGDARPSVYRFAAIAKDDNCDNPAKTVKGYTILVKPIAAAYRKYDIMACGKLKFQCYPIDTTNNETYNYEWTIRDSTNSGIVYKKSFNKKDSIVLKYGGKYIITHYIVNPKYTCPKIYQDTVIMPPILKVELAFGKDTFVCAGDSITLNPKIKNGVPTYLYYWETPFGTTYSSAEKITLKPTQNSSVLLKITDKNKCTDSDTIKIHYQPLPVVNIGADQRICTYQSIALDAQNADSLKYYWLPSGDSTRTIKTNIAGQYIAKVMDKLGCNTSDTMNLFVNDTVVAIAKPHQEICIFDTLKIKAQRKPLGYIASFIWQDLNTNIIVSNDSNLKQKINQNSARKYGLKLAVTQSGITCYNNDTMNLTVNALPTFQINPIPPLCYQEACINLTLRNAVVAMPSKSAVNYNCSKTKYISEIGGNIWWCPKDKITNDKLPKLGISDTVKVCYTDNKGCKNSANLILKVRPNPLVEVKNKLHCQKAGELVLDSLIVKPFSRLAGLESFRCIEAPVGVDMNNIITEGKYPTLLWKCNVGSEFEPNKTGNYKFEYCFRDGSTNCATCDTSNVTVISLPIIEFEPLPNQCVNFSGLALDSFVKEKNTAIRFTNGKWQCVAVNNDRNPNNVKLQNAIKNNNFFNPKVGAGIYLLMFTDISSGCPIQDSIEIVVNGLPFIKLQKIDTLCSSQINFPLISNYQNNLNGKWKGQLVENNYFLNAAKAPKNKQYEGVFTSTFTYTHPQTGCQNSDSIYTLVQNEPEITIINQKPYQLCEGKLFELKATKKFVTNTNWQTDGDGIFTNKNNLNTNYTHGVIDTSIGIFNIVLTSIKEGVCPAVKQILPIVIHPFPQFIFMGNPLEQCEKAIVSFTSNVSKPQNSNNLKYEWNFGNGSSINNDIANPQNILYDTAAIKGYNVKLTVKNQWGTNADEVCQTEQEKISYVKVYPMPIADFTSNPSYFTTVAFPKFQFINKSKVKFGELAYLWQFNDKNIDDTSTKENPLHIYSTDTSKYLVSLTAMYHYKISNGISFEDSIGTCSDIKTQERVVGDDITIFVPNAFSPEGTGPAANNVFKPIINGEKTYYLQIFNRWGELLWETSNKNLYWNGKYKNENCQQDVYIWKLQATAFNEKKYNYEGTVTLLR